MLTHGWAFGSGGDALQGKPLQCVISTGGQDSAYREGGYNNYTMDELLRPLEQTARLCGMQWAAPFLVQGTHALSDEHLGRRCEDYRELLAGLVQGAGRGDGGG